MYPAGLGIETLCHRVKESKSERERECVCVCVCSPDSDMTVLYRYDKAQC